MDNLSYQAMIVEEPEKKTFIRQIKTAQINDLPKGDVLIRVSYSSLNYKDALSATGNRGVTRQYPHTPGIDAAGIVEESLVEPFKKGEKVIVTSYDLGMNTSGGFGQYIRVPKDWVVKLPDGLDLKQSMIFGTAGFTAGMSIFKLTQTIRPEHGDILVTGATGGVGSMACGILSHLGYSVTAVTGKTDTALLNSLGVKTILSRDDFLENTKPPILKPQWAGVIDTVGGEILATAIKATKQNGIVTCCGNVASFDLPINVFPFILRGVSLLGIDSQHCPMAFRTNVWKKLATDWKFDYLDRIYDEIFFDQLEDKIQGILKGELKGRTLVNLK
ncbi:MAG: YhdH/YhfP family quinone oxidoreductase [Desulfobacula sp.]|uniref:YhdH/YhfP family quinone oxidoreductase n=1 Tax=Desulfobacula sp. TaxID=2593537 RepID=UPI001DD5B2A1|nr:YhdH/YhfP family quinone oxidoreductase [Desulfobacula sp.]MBT3485393.1 YhdH/YhfP family quinone oxidoreductase [Desulfobacula sp.]MBT3807100.1 YhdH/YhfP family quinone oxidoreductase [Desulfobacula sp.]MBT4027334.1 YhdH/YhfP family quinone oxidoreductase [Desulfobacula sp.]MBT4200506.1 YhdH/YhfP family quinone oxidoreductase [Desulfobacula sp.]